MASHGPALKEDRQPGVEATRPARSGRLAILTLGSIGVVYGDIGTSPIYAFREALRHVSGDGTTRAEVLGVVSLLLWALLLIVTLKYVLFLLRADNRGEGGILALLTLMQASLGARTRVLLLLGLAGASLFFGDAIITPAISVLSAVEGLELALPGFAPYVLPVTAGILVALFAIQRGGTGAVAAWFGPVTTAWFLAIGTAGLLQVCQDPAILAAIDPRHAAGFLAEHRGVGVLVLGAVFLAVTGAEALYADLGHFGRAPIQLAWFGLVLPALALNYLGQGALVIAHPETAANPFFLMVRASVLLPFVALATAATVIAAQAVITGAFSLTRQAIQLGFLPRLQIRHTSAVRTGQIYLPAINWLLLSGVLALVVVFERSSALASAYGIAVTGTMLVTTVLVFLYLRHARRWPAVAAFLLCLPFLAAEGTFLAANLLKLPDGGYVPVLLAAGLMTAMWSWSRGTAMLMERARRQSVPLAGFADALSRSSAQTVPGTAVFLTSDPEATPPPLLHNLKHNHVLHEKIIVLTVVTAEAPRIPDDERARIEPLGDRIMRVALRFGFMETPNVSRALGLSRRQGLKFDVMKTSFFLGRRKLVADARVGMPLWQDRLYIALSRLAADPSDFYHLPRERVVELGSRMAV